MQVMVLWVLQSDEGLSKVDLGWEMGSEGGVDGMKKKWKPRRQRQKGKMQLL
jgi:hypothetical protein